MLIQLAIILLSVTLVASILAFVLPLRSLLYRQRHCPRCGPGSRMMRIPRHSADRLFIGNLISCRRYRCLGCMWTGLFRESAPKGGGALPLTATDIEIPVFQEADKT